MKPIITILLLFFAALSYGQTYKSLIVSADSLYKLKEYQKAMPLCKKAFKIEHKNPNDLYNAACIAALSGHEKLAFKWLDLALKNGWSNVAHLKTDTDLTTLHDSKKWAKLVATMQTVVDKIEANYDKPLQSKLLAIFDDDQAIRRQYIAAQKEFGHQSKQVDSLSKIMLYKDSINLIQITEILDKYGWVGSDKVGGQANHTLFLVIQHADLKTQQKYLPMMRAAVKNNNASSSALALLEDRVALAEGKKQIYGSQIGYDSETNKSYVLPLEDPDNVDKRRAKMGLGSFADYVKRWDIVWNSEEYKKQLLLIEAKQKK
jgi:tetratricopeptide (TPR) repeat protein